MLMGLLGMVLRINNSAVVSQSSWPLPARNVRRRVTVRLLRACVCLAFHGHSLVEFLKGAPGFAATGRKLKSSPLTCLSILELADLAAALAAAAAPATDATPPSIKLRFGGPSN